ncbi:MAG TPA: energy transducer TonB, partial [Bryobacteraceae bacterium]|nr:energy transducer TonB [Bryobacteraceae bacterium]
TRSQQLVLEEADSKLFEKCFAGGDALFLLACPVAAKAAFFVREDGEMKCVYEFGLGSPFAAGVAAQGLPSPGTDEIAHPPPEIQTPLLAVSRSIPPADKEDTASDSIPLLDRELRPELAIRNRVGRAMDHGLVKPSGRRLGGGAGFKKEMWLAAALIFSVFLGAGIGMLVHSRPPSVHLQALPTNDLHLTVEGNGSLLRLHWDQNASGIGNPSRAVMHIEDGEYQMVRNLAPSEFKAGSVAYEPRSRDVSFRVEVFSPTANASGLVQVVNLPAQAAVTPVQPPERLFKPSARYPAAELPASKPSAARLEPTAAVPAVKEKEEVSSTALRSSNGADTASVVKRDTSPPTDFGKEPPSPSAERPASPVPVPEPSVRVWPEAVAGSSWGRLVGKVPLVRRLRKTAKISTPAPIIQAQPVLTSAAKQSVTRPVSVDVRVDVGQSGLVESAEVVEFSDPLNVALTNSALAAAVRWTFEPARSDEIAVPSKVILHFRFTP